MEFGLSEETRLLISATRAFARREIEGLAREIEEKDDVPSRLIRKMAEMGLMGVLVPAAYGGAGMDTLSYTVAMEEVAYASASASTIMTAHNSLVCEPILEYGTNEQKVKYLIPLARGEYIGCFGLTESNAGSDVSAITTKASRRGGGYVIDGEKRFITNGRRADIAIIFAVTEKKAGRKGISAFIVERGRGGFSTGRIEDKLGIRGSEAAELIFDECLVPEENLLGCEGDGFKIAMQTLDSGRIGIAAQAVGIARASFDAAVKYARERRQFGMSIAGFQAIQFMLSDMATWIDAARLLTYRAAMLKDQKKRYVKEASMAKLYASIAANRVADSVLQIHGGYGYIKEYPVERYYRDARVTTIYEGTSEIQRLIIAREILGSFRYEK